MKHRYKQLEKEGWLRQFVADETLAKDAVEIYNLLGYEVHLQSLQDTHSKKDRSSPSEEFRSRCQIVYIRPKTSQDNEEKQTEKRTKAKK
ncbi:MAG: hypothetical protein HXY44_08700 [Syntrophaceae bacterium]|nr:hypothetical protein [Syntrophaceae bacterium]